jgi:hypothetical protein
MWRFYPLSRRHHTRPKELPSLPNGRSYFAVVDVEALVMGKMDIVEQVAFILVDIYGNEVVAEKHMIYQPLNADQLAHSYNIDIKNVQKGIDGYKLVTQDNYIHDNPYIYERWGPVRKRIVQMCQLYAAAVYAKGIELEARVFYGELPLMDLAWWGCPRYPGQVHDPLAEIRFFAGWIPDLITKRYFVC